jgi:hypothetical protein
VLFRCSRRFEIGKIGQQFFGARHTQSRSRGQGSLPLSARHGITADLNRFVDKMSTAGIQFISSILGALISGGIGIWMFWVKSCRDGKGAFLLVTADLERQTCWHEQRKARRILC